ncbi:MAG: orotidine-5'-phosphate decarboxylase [Anaerolineales bacterium]|jgi:uridine monophosphate synthetase
MGFFSRLELRARQANSLLCVGLDPHPEDLLDLTPDAARSFCLSLIEETAEFAAAFKPNAAFFEVFGAQGITVLQEIIAAVPEQIPVILDAKRGDIASTARMYAAAAFQTLGADALTVNPYLGYDSLVPFIEEPQRGVFLLCKTSNPGAADLQDLFVGEHPQGTQAAPVQIYEHLAALAGEWNQNDNLGLVVGATQVQALARVRRLAPELWILAPGVGAQGGDLKAALEVGLREDGLGLLIPVSRGIARASDPKQKAKALREAINRARTGVEQTGMSAKDQHEDGATIDFPASLADRLLDVGCIKFGQFRLKSGLISPIYIDLRLLTGDPELLSQVAAAYLPILESLRFERLAALPYAALPIGTAISLQGGWPLVYPRKEAKSYGTRAEVEGRYEPGEKVVVIDDLATTGGSKFEAIEKLTQAGLQVEDVVVLVDRQSGASQALSAAGYTLRAVFTMNQLLDHWERTARVPAQQIDDVRQFLAADR